MHCDLLGRQSATTVDEVDETGVFGHHQIKVAQNSGCHCLVNYQVTDSQMDITNVFPVLV